MLETLERVLRDRTVHFLELKNLLMVEQHGFWDKDYRETNLIGFPEESMGMIDRKPRSLVPAILEGLSFHEPKAP